MYVSGWCVTAPKKDRLTGPVVRTSDGAVWRQLVSALGMWGFSGKHEAGATHRKRLK